MIAALLAAALAVFGSLTGQVLAAVTMRRGFNAALLWPFILGGLVGVPVGASLLPHLNAHWFKARCWCAGAPPC